jgi:hypothetical protein
MAQAFVVYECSLLPCVTGRALESIAAIAGFEHMVMMHEPAQQCGGELRIAEHRDPFREAQVGADDEAGSRVELALQVKEQRPVGLAEGQIARFIQDDEVGMDEPLGQLPWRFSCSSALTS